MAGLCKFPTTTRGRAHVLVGKKGRAVCVNQGNPAKEEEEEVFLFGSIIENPMISRHRRQRSEVMLPGLKHFLVQFPEFAIDGSKGCPSLGAV